MVSVSLCMIVKNEQTVLERCLKSVKDFTDEIIIVDTGSDDSTKDIAKEYAQVYDFEWCDDFSAARNFAFSKAACDYIMWLDADDVINKDSLQKLIFWKKNQQKDDIDVIMMPYHLNIDEKGNAGFVYYRERILRRKSGFLWQGAVHECIQPSGIIAYIDAYVEHRKQNSHEISDRNLKIYEKQLEKNGGLDTREKFYYARELMTHGMFEKAEQMFNCFLNDKNAWIENKIEAYRNLSYCLSMQNKYDEAKTTILKSFAIDTPRAESCCDLAVLCIKQNEYSQAKFWYEIAYNQFPNTKNGGFTQPDCYGYIPCLGLCICFDKLGDKVKAKYWNERAAIFKPNSDAVISNRVYFGSL